MDAVITKEGSQVVVTFGDYAAQGSTVEEAVGALCSVVAAGTANRARRAADLTPDELEALRQFIAEWAEPHAYGDAPVPSAKAIAAVARLTKGPTP